jgi:endonuclease/exonuclease/phosphatase (EEP) superfamily protein YafD
VNLAAFAAAFLIVFSMLAPWMAAADSVGHFRFHLTVALLVAVALQVATRQWRPALAGVAVSAVGIAGMAPAIPAWGTRQAGAEISDTALPLTLVQLNLSFRNAAPEAVADFVRREKADVVTLQEVTAGTGRVILMLAREYPYHVLCPFAPVGGVAVLSRLPMAPGASRGCADGQGMAWIRVIAAGQPVSIASMHLHWPWPFRQNDQVARLRDGLREIPRPVIVAGDFNAAPWSESVARVARDTDTTVARGLRFSFDIRIADWTPPISMPIDQILLPSGVVPLQIRLGPRSGSDHRSVIAELSLPQVSTKQAGIDPKSARDVN